MKKSSKTQRSSCPIANTLDILGDRWTLIIIRDLMFREKREYGELLNSEEGISSSVLATRLEQLQCTGIITKTDHPTDQKKYRYHLTAKGIDLMPMMIDVVLWGMQHVPGTLAPPDILNAMQNDREGFIKMMQEKLLMCSVTWFATQGCGIRWDLTGDAAIFI
jgi:DNA-binding HxlR family transcriptional regulator